MLPLLLKGHMSAKRWWVAATSALLVFLVALGASIPLYVYPRTSSPAQSGAVVVLGPPRQERIDRAFEVADELGIDRILISVSPWNHAAFKPESIEACEDARVECFVPEPLTTSGEAIAIDRIAKENGWQAVTLITMSAHATRSQMIFEQCSTLITGVQVADTSLTFGEWAYQYAYQSAGFLKFWIVGCPSA